MPADQSRDAQYYLSMVSAYEREFAKWEKRADKILKKYKDERLTSRSDEVRFNILWSNVNTLVPAVFSKLPKPDVSRRFRDNDPVGRVASLMLERALEFEIEHYPDYRAAMRNAVYDRFLPGRGTAWVRYEPHFRQAEQDMPVDGVQITEDADEGQEEQTEVIDYECAPVDYVHWRDFGHTLSRTWEEVTCIWRRVYMGRTALVERFGKIGKKIPLDTRPETTRKLVSDVDADDVTYQACIYEVWDKETNKALWISKSMEQIIDDRDDPLELESFFPCARPLYATITNESLVPVPDYALYQDQAQSLDRIAERIDGLINALQIRGVYDVNTPELGRIFTEGFNTNLVPVKNWAGLTEKGGLKGALDMVDIQPIVLALIESYRAMDQVKNQIYDITGLSDIIRGQSNANETATAQQIKGQYASLRLKSMQQDVAQFAAELLQIKAQIICKLFSPETIMSISAAEQMSQTDQQLIPQALELLKNEPLRNFRIGVSSDSMIQMDEAQEKADRMEFLTATGSFLERSLPVIQASPTAAPLLVELLKFGVTAFKVGKSIEGQFDETLDKLMEQAANPQPQPNPEVMKVQAESQARQQEMQMKAQLDAQQIQAHMQLEQHKQQLQAQQVQLESQAQVQRDQLSLQNEAKLEQMRMEFDHRMIELQENVKLIITKLSNAAKIEVAQIQAETTLHNAHMNAEAKVQEHYD